MIAFGLACALVKATIGAQQSERPPVAISAPVGPTIDDVVQRVRAGSFPEALALAGEIPDALDRARASVYVRHQGGDLAGALSAAEAGLASAPADPWLLEQCAYVAISLRDVERAERSVQRLEQAVRASKEPEASRLASVAADLALQTRTLAGVANARERAMRRATITVFTGIGFGVAGLVFLARRSASPPGGAARGAMNLPRR